MAPALIEILRAQEMQGERLVNHIRLGFVLFSLAGLLSVWDINTPAANTIFLIQVGLWLAYTLGLYAYFQFHKERYVSSLKYLSITVDLTLLSLAAMGARVNHSGIIEYFQGYMQLVFVLWNLMSGFRYSLSACLYSGALTLLLNAAILFDAATSGLVEVSPVTVYGANAINIGDQIIQILFLALPAIIAGIIAKIARKLVLRAEEESLRRAKAEQERDYLGKYLSKELVEVVLADPSRMVLGGARQNATIMFTDLRNFTPMSERQEPEAVVKTLNAYFTRMVSIVFRYGGTLDKFTGDGLMALFGAPLPLESAPKRALAAATEMLQEIKGFNIELESQGLPALDMSVGIATGIVVAGNIGSPDRMEYTCIGDTVNFAARLEKASRDLGANIVLSQSTFTLLGGDIPLRRIPPIKLKGKRDKVEVYVLDGSRLDDDRLTRFRKELLGIDRSSALSAAS